MAIDTAVKKASIIGIVIPDGTIAQADRQAVLWIYSGILATPANAGTLAILVADDGEANDASDCTIAASATVAHSGSNSYKVTKTSAAAGNAAKAHIHDSVAGLHGLTAGKTYTWTSWMYSPTTGGPSTISEVSMVAYDTTLTSTMASAALTAKDTWQLISLTFTIPSGTTVVDLYYDIASAAESGEFIYFDDAQVYQHYDVTVSGPIEDYTSVVLPTEGNYVEMVSDGDKYLVKDGRVTYTEGWIANSEWRSQDFKSTHNLGLNHTDLDVKFFLSVDGTEAQAFQMTDSNYNATSAAENFGYVVAQTSVNEVNIPTAAQGFLCLDYDGALRQIDTEAWFYKIVVTRAIW